MYPPGGPDRHRGGNGRRPGATAGVEDGVPGTDSELKDERLAGRTPQGGREYLEVGARGIERARGLGHSAIGRVVRPGLGWPIVLGVHDPAPPNS